MEEWSISLGRLGEGVFSSLFIWGGGVQRSMGGKKPNNRKALLGTSIATQPSIRCILCPNKVVVVDEKGKNVKKHQSRQKCTIRKQSVLRRGGKRAKVEEGVAVAVFRCLAVIPILWMVADMAQRVGERDLFHPKKAKRMKNTNVEKEEKEGNI